MKKQLVGFAVLLVCLFSIVGCSQNTEETVSTAPVDLEQVSYVFSFSDISTEVTLEYTGDTVVTEIIKTTESYEALGVENKTQAKEKIDEQVKEQGYDNVAGITHTAEYKDNEVTEQVDINFDIVDLSELQNLAGLNLPSDTSNGVSLSAMEQVLEAAQFQKQS